MLGVIFSLSDLTEFRQKWVTFLEIRKGHMAVTNNPYKFDRYPIYELYYKGLGISFLSSNWVVSLS